MARMRQVGIATALALLALHSAGHAQGGLRASVYASGFNQPVAIVQDPTNPFVQFVVEQAGRVRVVSAGTRLPTDFLDLRSAVRAGGERGLLGLAFTPDYASSGRFLVIFASS